MIDVILWAWYFKKEEYKLQRDSPNCTIFCWKLDLCLCKIVALKNKYKPPLSLSYQTHIIDVWILLESLNPLQKKKLSNHLALLWKQFIYHHITVQSSVCAFKLIYTVC